jgi:hypothetical protein
MDSRWLLHRRRECNDNQGDKEKDEDRNYCECLVRSRFRVSLFPEQLQDEIPDLFDCAVHQKKYDHNYRDHTEGEIDAPNRGCHFSYKRLLEDFNQVFFSHNSTQKFGQPPVAKHTT